MPTYQDGWSDNSYLLYQEQQYLASLVIVSDPGDEVEHIYANI